VKLSGRQVFGSGDRWHLAKPSWSAGRYAVVAVWIRLETRFREGLGWGRTTVFEFAFAQDGAGEADL